MPTAARQVVRYNYPESDTNRLFRADGLAMDLLTVAGSAFDVEKTLHHGSRTTDLILPLHDFGRYNRKRLENSIADVLLYVLAENVRVVFEQAVDPPKPLRKPPAVSPLDHVCLFSGGVDSLSGILNATEALADVGGVFCAHSDQARIVKIVEDLETSAFAEKKLSLRKISVPAVGIRGYAQLRGFLYCVAAAAWIHLTKAKSLIVTECGPTMYQPLFSPLDSITMTTHPVVLRHAKSVIETVLRRSIRLLTPYEDFTKAEVVAACPRPDLISVSHSCISQRFGTHDGTCYGCVIRRLATQAAGVQDVVYARDPLLDEGANAGNLMSLLTFSHDCLLAYEHMEDFEKEKIERYGKRDLFTRFALDHFAAIHDLVLRDLPVRRGALRLYDRVAWTLGRPALEARLHDLRTKDLPIDWRRTPPI